MVSIDRSIGRCWARRGATGLREAGGGEWVLDLHEEGGVALIDCELVGDESRHKKGMMVTVMVMVMAMFAVVWGGFGGVSGEAVVTGIGAPVPVALGCP